MLLDGDVDAERAERIRELVKIVQESGVGEIEIEDEGMRVSVRRADEGAPAVAYPAASSGVTELDASPPVPAAGPIMRVESPMVGVFFRAPEPSSPSFVEVGDVVEAGQTLCLLEAMKLFNELKAESPGVVRAIHAENGEPVEFGQLLFELDPISQPPTL